MSAPAGVVGRETPRDAESPQQAAQRLAEKAGALRDGFRLECLFTYRDADGSTFFWRIRAKHPDGRKWIRPMRRTAGGGFEIGEPTFPAGGKPLFNLPGIVAAPPDAPVFVVEGELCVVELVRLKIAATTSGGANSAAGADWAPLRGRHVVIWPDADEPGAKYAQDVARVLQGLGCSIEIVDVEALGLPKGGDCVDWLTAHPSATAADVMTLPRNTISANCANSAEESSAQEWPELVPLDAPTLPRIVPEMLPGWAGDFARALAEHTETPLELSAAMVLAACSVAAARRLRVLVRPDYFEPCNLWWLVALPSGSRKSAVQKCATGPLLTWESEQAAALAPEIKRITSARKTMEEQIKVFRRMAAAPRKKGPNPANPEECARRAAEMEAELPEIPIPPRLWTSDATPEKLGVLLAEHHECMGWLSSEGGVFDLLAGRYSNGVPNLDLVLKAHAGDAERVDRGSRPPVFVQCPRLTVGLSPQPDVLRGLTAKPGFRGRGLLARFLYLLPPSNLGFRTLRGAAIPEGVRSAYAAGLGAMLNWKPAADDNGRERTHLLRLSAGALQVWEEFSRAVEVRMRPGGDFAHCMDWAGKAPGAAARLAAVLHGIEHAHGQPWDTEITPETMGAALDILAVVSRHTLVALELMGADETVAAARTIWGWIQGGRLERFTEREAFNALRGSFPRMSALREALGVLVERGYITVQEPPRDSRGRPPSPVVVVRPELVGG